MKPAVFTYLDPRSLGEALDALDEYGDTAAVLAGGQSLIPLLNMRLARPDVLVDINRVPGLGEVRCAAGSVRMGALARASAVERDPEVARVLPVLVQAVRHIAHPQIRSRTTIGGSIAHAHPASELPAVLAALDGTVRLTSARGDRRVSWADFFRSAFTTARAPDELVTEVIFPVPAGFTFRYVEFARHHGSFPIAGVCLGLRVSRGVIGEARLAATGVADRPVRLRAAEAALTGRPVGAAAAREAGELAARAVHPPSDAHGDAAFRRGVLATLVRRAVESWEAADGTREGRAA